MHRETFEIIEGQQEHFGYAQAVRVGDMIWVANTPGCDDSLIFADNMAGQLRQVYLNLTTTSSTSLARSQISSTSPCSFPTSSRTPLQQRFIDASSSGSMASRQARWWRCQDSCCPRCS